MKPKASSTRRASSRYLKDKKKVTKSEKLYPLAVYSKIKPSDKISIRNLCLVICLCMLGSKSPEPCAVLVAEQIHHANQAISQQTCPTAREVLYKHITHSKACETDTKLFDIKTELLLQLIAMLAQQKPRNCVQLGKEGSSPVPLLTV